MQAAHDDPAATRLPADTRDDDGEDGPVLESSEPAPEETGYGYGV